MILLYRASSPPSPSRFYSLDMTRVISYTVDEVFRSCFLHTVLYTNHCGSYFTMYFYSHRPWKITTSTYTTTFFLFLFVLLVVFLDKTRTQDMDLVIQERVHCQHPIGSTPKKNCLLNTLESAWRDIGGNSPPKELVEYNTPLSYILTFAFSIFLPENTDMFLLLGFFFPRRGRKEQTKTQTRI